MTISLTNRRGRRAVHRSTARPGRTAARCSRPHAARGPSDTSLVDQMVEDLAMRIIDGSRRPGADVNSVDLARRYGSSRTPVREALLTLQREGLVDIPARRRPRVALVTLDQVREIYEVRASLHGLVSELIVQERRRHRPGRPHRVPVPPARRRGARRRRTVLLAQRRVPPGRGRDRGESFAHPAAVHTGPAHTAIAPPEPVVPRPPDRSVDDHERLLAAYAERDEPLAVALTKSIIMAGYRAIEASGWSGLEKDGQPDD